MWKSLRIGAAIFAVVGLVMGGLAVAHAVDEPDPARDRRPGAEQVIMDALTPLLEDGTLTREQAAAVVDELASLVVRARFQEETKDLVKRLGRLAAEIAEVLGIRPDDLGEQLQAGLTLAEIAEANGSTGEQLVTQVTDHIEAHLAVRVTAGKLDQAHADEIAAQIELKLSGLVDVEHPFGSVLEERRNRALRIAGLDAAADFLGLPIDDMRAQLEEGISLAQIAARQGVGEHELIDAILAPLAARIEQAVERGRLSADEAAEALERAAERLAGAIQKAPGA